jgi:hypothetical protein
MSDPKPEAAPLDLAREIADEILLGSKYNFQPGMLRFAVRDLLESAALAAFDADRKRITALELELACARHGHYVCTRCSEKIPMSGRAMEEHAATHLTGAALLREGDGA